MLSDGGYKDNHGNPDYETVEFDDDSQIHLGGLEYEGESKDVYHFAVILSMTGCLAGCGSGETANNPGSRAIKEKINIKDIAWNVDEGIVGGERYVLLSYTNDTQCTITNFEIIFNEKAGITEEEKSDFYSDIQKKFELSDEDMDDLKSRSISMHAETDRVVKPGESISNVNCYYYGGSFYLKDINHYNLVEPDIATIKYLEEDKIFTVYYDYGSKNILPKKKQR